MAYGQIQTFVWIGNPSRPLPAILSVSDSYGAAVLNQITETSVQDALLATELELLRGAIVQINASISVWADHVEGLPALISDLEVSLKVASAAEIQSNSIASIQIAEQVKTNNWTVFHSDEKPIMPSVKDQLDAAVKDSASMVGAMRAFGMVNSAINDAISTIGIWISGTAVYMTISTWLHKITGVITGSFTTSMASITSKIRALLPPGPG